MIDIPELCPVDVDDPRFDPKRLTLIGYKESTNKGNLWHGDFPAYVPSWHGVWQADTPEEVIDAMVDVSMHPDRADDWKWTLLLDGLIIFHQGTHTGYFKDFAYEVMDAYTARVEELRAENKSKRKAEQAAAMAAHDRDRKESRRKEYEELREEFEGEEETSNARND